MRAYQLEEMSHWLIVASGCWSLPGEMHEVWTGKSNRERPLGLFLRTAGFGTANFFGTTVALLEIHGTRTLELYDDALVRSTPVKPAHPMQSDHWLRTVAWSQESPSAICFQSNRAAGTIDLVSDTGDSS